VKYFTKVADGIDIRRGLTEVAMQGSRLVVTDPPNPLGYEVGSKEYHWTERARVAHADGTRTVGGEEFPQYPAVQALLRECLEAVGIREACFAARVRLMPPRTRMKPHRDIFDPCQRRYMLAMMMAPQAFFAIKDERCRMKPGELWEVRIANHSHYFSNLRSSDWRVALIFDTVQTAAFERYPELAEKVADAQFLLGLADRGAPDPVIGGMAPADRPFQLPREGLTLTPALSG